jgi:hypothetical protein
MADSTISALTAAAALTGTEVLPVAQATSTVRTTTQAVANLASATSAKINTVSNALSNLTSLHNVLSNRVSANSAVGGAFNASVLSTPGTSATSVQGAQSVMNTLSGRIVSVNDHASAASAAATSADGHANTISTNLATLSLAVSALSTHVDVASAAATSADAHANTVSVQAAGTSVQLVSVQSIVGQLASIVSLVSTASAAGTAVGLQSVVDALSQRISILSQATSVADAAMSVDILSLHSTVSHLASIVSLVSAVSAAGTAVGLQSVVNALSNRISALTGGGTTSDQVSAMIASVASTKYTALTSIGGLTSTKGIQSALNNLSMQISSLNSIVSNSLSAGDVMSANFTSVQSTVAHLASIVSLVSTVSAAGTAVGLQSVVNALSQRISILSQATSVADAAMSVDILSLHSTVSHLASIVSLVSTVSAAGTAVGLQSVVNALSARIAAIPGGSSAAPIGRVSTANVICAAALANLSGLTVSVSVGGQYELRGMIIYSVSAITGHAFGLTFPAMTQAAGMLQGATSTTLTGGSTFSSMVYGPFGAADSGGAVWSAIAGTAGTKYFLNIDGALLPSATGKVVAQARGSVATNAVTILPGSFLRVFRLN